MKFNKNDVVKIVDSSTVWDNKSAIVLGESPSDDEELTLVKVKIPFTDIEGEEKNIIEIFPEDFLVGMNETKSITEALQKPQLDDYIKNYLYQLDIDGNLVPSWMFASQIAMSENMEEAYVVDDAKTLGYRRFSIIASDSQFYTIIIANKNCDVNIIKEDYADFLLGKVKVEEF